MKKVLIIYGEEKVKIDKGNNIYTSSTLPKEMWDNCYLKLSDSITFLARKDNNVISSQSEILKYNKLDNKVKYVELEDNKGSLVNFFSLNLRKKIKNTIKNAILSSDAVIVRVPSSYSYIAINYCLKYNKKVIVEVVGCAFNGYWYHSLKGKIIAPFEFLKMRYFVKKASAAVYVTNHYLQKKYPNFQDTLACSDSILKIDNGVLNRRIKKIENDTNGKKIIIGSCGAIDIKYKGFQYVIKAITLLQTKYEIEYQIVGGGRPSFLHNVAMNNKVENNVKFLGVMNHDDIFKWLDQIDIYIQPSDTEGLSRSLLEAISRAVPTIASNAGGNVELVSSQYIFKKGNFKELSKKIDELCQNKEERISQSTLNYRTSQLYKSSILLKNRTDFYSSIFDLGERYEKD